MSFSGKFIAIEGLEGAGKSTAVELLVNRLQQASIQVLITREPGGTAIGEILRSILKDPRYKETLNAKTELLLLYAARIQLINEVILPALKQGIWVITDRFELSTFAYQGGGRGLNKEFIKQLSAYCLEGFSPDLTLFLDISPEEGMARARQRGKADRIEQESMAFFHKIYDAYMKLITLTPNVKIINASAPLNEVQNEISQIIDNYLITHANL
ncbi:dTMP kinase [Legionella israelensis]|nr:thymidylate kinase [Legionella israelensis]SCX91587.1 thymidylate kinase [Legionella israelensis DSM 19235]STX58057.1 dTMP kinase [Legionella israelensis]